MSKIKQNLLYNASYQLLVILTPIIIMPHISRVLGPENIGIYSYTHSVAHYFVIFGMLGIHNYGSRTISRSRYDKNTLSKTFISIYLLQFITSLISTIGYLVFISISNNSSIKIFLYLHLIYVMTNFTDINWFFFGIEQFQYSALRSIFVKILNVISILLVVRNENDLIRYTIIMCITILLNNVLLWPVLFKYIIYVKVKIEDVMSHFKPNLILFIPVLAVSLYNIMDKVMIGSLSSMTELGYYENTSKVVGIPFGIVAALGTVMLPRMSNLFSEGKIKESNRYLRISMKFIIIVSSGMAFGIAGVAEVFAPVFFGEQFSSVGNLIIIMGPLIIIKAWANVIRTQILIPRLRDKEYIFSVIAGAISNLLVNSFLVRPYGALGAIIGTLVAEFVVAITQTYSVRGENIFLNIFKENIYYILNGILMFILVRFIGIARGISISTLLVQISIGFLFYSILSIIFFFLTSGNDMKKSIGKLFAGLSSRL